MADQEFIAIVAREAGGMAREDCLRQVAVREGLDTAEDVPFGG